jgi:hypothetical protein
MSDTVVTQQASEQIEEAQQAEEDDVPSSEVLPTRYIPWIPVLAFAQIVCIYTIFYSVLTL